MRSIRWIFVFLLAAALPGALSFPAQAAAGASETENFVQTVGERAMTLAAAYRDHGDPRDRKALETLIRNNFDLVGGTRFVLGRHWNEATETQRQKLVVLLPNYAMEVAVRTLSTLKKHQLKSFSVAGSRPFGPDTLVVTRVQLDESEPFDVGWRVRTIDGKPKVTDAIVQGVSIAVAIREAVDSVIDREGVAGLINEVQAKLTQMQAANEAR